MELKRALNETDDQSRGLKRAVMGGLYEKHLFRTWLNGKPEGWELVSGLWSPLYIQIRHLPSFPELFDLVADAMATQIRTKAPEVNRIIGIASAGVPLATAISQKLGLPMAYTRKVSGARTLADLRSLEAEYAEHALVEGELGDGDRIALIDDVAAMLTSKDVAVEQVLLEAQRRGLSDVRLAWIAVVIDRQQAHYDPQRFHGAQLLPLVRLVSEGIEMLDGFASQRELIVLRQYLADPHAFQAVAVRDELIAEAKAALEDRKT